MKYLEFWARAWPPGWRLAVVAAALVVGISATAIVSGQLGGTERRLAPVSEEQARKDLPNIFESGDPVAFGTVEIPDNIDPPTMFGPYRLVPWGFVGDLPYERLDIPRGVQTTDITVIRESSLYRDLAAEGVIPDELEFRGADTGIETTEDLIHSLYSQPDRKRGIEVWNIRPSLAPYGIDLPQDGTWRTAMLGGLHMTVVNHVPGIKGNESGFVRVQVFLSDGERVALIESDYYAEDTLIRIAQAMFESGKE